MQLFRFEPGDGTSYRVLFGRLPGPNRFVPQYTLFGFGVGDAPLVCFPFDAPHVSFDTFARHLPLLVDDPEEREAATWTAYHVYEALIGEVHVAPPDSWRVDWREQLPPRLTS
jgi:hypothetical protein